MATNSDCGVTLLGNILSPLLRRLPGELRSEITGRFGFPNEGSWRDDFWDNPARHEEIIRDYLGDRGLNLRVMPEGSPEENCGVLVYNRSRPWMWHWVLYLGFDPGIQRHVFHDGRQLTHWPSREWNPGQSVEVLRYAIVAPNVGEGLKTRWYFWRWLMKLFVK